MAIRNNYKERVDSASSTQFQKGAGSHGKPAGLAQPMMQPPLPALRCHRHVNERLGPRDEPLDDWNLELYQK